MFKKYYLIKQHDETDCGAACLATISKQHGLQIPVTKIREIAGTDKQGTNAYGVIKAAERLGFSAKGVKGDQEAFFSDFPLPCIAHVVVNGNLLHYVVIHKITPKEIIIADPGVGLVKLTPEEFFEGKREKKEAAIYQWSGVLIIMLPSSEFKKSKETKSLFGRFFHLIIRQKQLIAQIFIASVIYTLFAILAAFYFKIIVDSVLPAGLTRTLHIVSIGVLLLHIFQILLNAIRSHMLLYLSQKLDISLILGYYHHVLELPMNFFGTRKVGEIISRFQDASKVREAISGATLTVMIDSIMVVAGGIILYIQNGRMFGITVIIVMLYVIIVLAFQKSYRRLNEKQMEDNAQLTSYMVESLNGIQTVKAHNAERKVILKTEKKFIRLLRSIFKLCMTSNIQESLKSGVELIGGIIILWVGAYYAIQGTMSVGQLILFNSLLAYFLTPIKNLVNLQPMLLTASVASDRLGEILDLEIEKQKNEERKAAPESLKGDITVQNLSFRYGTRKLVLEDISLEIKQGERIAFVGESGSGKTTLAKLLLKLYTAEQGEILIKDINIKDVRLEVLREKIAYIPQETFLFSGSVLDNLVLGLDTDDYTMEDVIEACKQVKAHDFINELPLRYETHLEENGANLSGGQRQRLAIARAILRRPDILILDEATSNLDSVTESAIEETLHGYTENVTTIIIAHRLSTIKRCDRIYVIDKGKIAERGSHAELIQTEGIYSDLWERQS